MSAVLAETVYTITDWYNGAQSGVADFKGNPCYYECVWAQNEADLYYLLTPIDAETFRLALEDWAIWKRWETAFREGTTTHDAHPALPEDQLRHQEIEMVLVEKLVIHPGFSFKGKGDFHYGEDTSVEWTVIS